MSLFRSSLIIFSLICISACQKSSDQTQEKQSKVIIIYGSDTCDHCVDFKAQLDSVGLTYDFRDVEVNYNFTNEMLNKVQAARITGRINYPVVDIEGKILVAPALGEVLALM